MDDRQTKITEGAGLEESRLNQEFIDWLNKWGFRILMCVLVLAAAWVGKTKWDEHNERKLDTALVELESELATRSPDGLIALAKKHSGIDSVWQQAMLNAAAIKLEAGRKALRPGGDPQNPEDFLVGDAANKQIEEAGELYTQVIDRVGRDSTKITALDARSGRVAALISLQDGEGARSELTELIALLDKSGYADLKRQAEERLENLNNLVASPMPIQYVELAAISEMRAPIPMYGESLEEVLEIRDRMLSRELVDPDDGDGDEAADEPAAEVGPALPTDDGAQPEAPAPTGDEGAEGGQ